MSEGRQARIVHISDVHFGRIRTTQIVDHLVEQINALSPTVVVLSGDITQRARRNQWREAVGFLARFEADTLVIPGNHDVYAWWYVHYRLTKPLARYEKYISSNLTPVFENDALRMVGVNSAHGWTVKGGRFLPEDIAAAGSFFAHADPDQFKVLVIHHHLVALDQIGDHDVAIRGDELLTTISNEKVPLVLCGHLHQSHIEVLESQGEKIVVASAGTATSDRGRKSNLKQNYFNIVDVFADRFCIQEMLYSDEDGEFSQLRKSEFRRES